VRWLAKAGVRTVPPTRGPAFSLFSLALQTAIDGSGVLIGRQTLVQDALASGQLDAPFELRLPVADRHTLLFPEDRSLSIWQKDLIDWLRHETAE
jgi:LysR family glycine cleavage system transcriptional activator